MSKVICDVCGTTYPDTASACPICGSARNTTVQTAADGTGEEQLTGYTYVKGGRFSKKNVRKRNQNNPPRRSPRREPEEDDDDETEGSNNALIVVVVMLVVAILCVLAYIGVSFMKNNPKKPNPGETTSATQTPNASTEGEGVKIPCTGLILDSSELRFVEENKERLLAATVEPRNTTEDIVFASSDESVATVSTTGLITPVGYGECVITVTCGNQKAECKVTCTFGTPPETDPVIPEVTVPEGFVLSLNRKDFTLSTEGEKWMLYKETNGVKADSITWESSDEKIATVKDGMVVGVDYGDATITATIGDQKATCVVRVRFHATQGGEVGGEDNTLKISHRDVTLQVGETFSLKLTDSRGVPVNVDWQADAEGYVSINGNKITGEKATVGTDQKFVTVTAEYEGTTYSCVVRVAAPKDT